MDNLLIIAASKWLQPHLNRFTHESNEWSWVTFVLMALGAHLQATWDRLALALAPSLNMPLVCKRIIVLSMLMASVMCSNPVCKR